MKMIWFGGRIWGEIVFLKIFFFNLLILKGGGEKEGKRECKRI